MKAGLLVQLLMNDLQAEVAVHAGDALYFPLEDKDISLNNEANAWIIEIDLKTKRPIGIVIEKKTSLMP